MKTAGIAGWGEHLQRGSQYLRTAERGGQRPHIFTNELVFQLAVMGLEHLLAGICQYHRTMPTDHTLSGLVATLETVCPLDGRLAGRIAWIEAQEDLCSLSPAQRPPPSDTVIRSALAAGEELLRVVEEKIPAASGGMGASMPTLTFRDKEQQR